MAKKRVLKRITAQGEAVADFVDDETVAMDAVAVGDDLVPAEVAAEVAAEVVEVVSAGVVDDAEPADGAQVVGVAESADEAQAVGDADSADADDYEVEEYAPTVHERMRKLETAIARCFEMAFQVLMADMWQSPGILVIMGSVAGGMFGWHLSALCIGFLQTSLLSKEMSAYSRFWMELIIFVEAFYVPNMLRCVSLLHLGDSCATVCALQLVTPALSASLTLSIIVFISSSWSSTLCILLHSFYMAAETYCAR